MARGKKCGCLKYLRTESEHVLCKAVTGVFRESLAPGFVRDFSLENQAEK